MTYAPISSDIYRFGDFSLDTRTRELKSSGGTVLSITSKALDTLSYLVTNRDRVVSKDELLNAVWPGLVVEENNLNQAVSALRNALVAGAKDRRFIVTLPGKRYRFVAEAGVGTDQSDTVIVKKANYCLQLIKLLSRRVQLPPSGKVVYSSTEPVTSA